MADRANPGANSALKILSAEGSEATWAFLSAVPAESGLDNSQFTGTEPWLNLSPFTPKKVGAHRKMYCSDACENDFHREQRLRAQYAFAQGKVTRAAARAHHFVCDGKMTIVVWGASMTQRSKEGEYMKAVAAQPSSPKLTVTTLVLRPE